MRGSSALERCGNPKATAVDEIAEVAPGNQPHKTSDLFFIVLMKPNHES